MPYIITTSQPFDATVHVHRPAFTRTAVATLDEAQRAAAEACALAEAGGKAGVWDVRFAPFEYAAAELPDEGGTVGPLPDGTVIEVRHLPGREGWRTLAEATRRVYATGAEAEILAAFNAQ